MIGRWISKLNRPLSQRVFTIPRMLRPLFFRRRKLRGVLARTRREPPWASTRRRYGSGIQFNMATAGLEPCDLRDRTRKRWPSGATA